jgi:hypothetical protein
MKVKGMRIKGTAGRENERGAALVMALLVSFLLLVASAGLLLEAAFNTQNVTDATAEQQAYNAAESGIQSAVNVLRGNVAPNPLIDSTKPATDPANKINFVKALRVSTSNVSGDTAVPRMSRWLGYDGTCTERVVIGGVTCSRPNGYGYSLQISDPDNTGSIVSYSTSGYFFDVSGHPTSITWGSGANTTVVSYVPVTVNNLDTTGGSAATNFGSFNVTVNGTGGLIPSYTRFEIVVTMSQPYFAVRVLRGWIESNTAATTNQAPKLVFDAQTYTLQGSLINLGFAWGSPAFVSDHTPPQHYGYEAAMSTGSGNIIQGTLSSPEPIRLLVRSTGYGPRGAAKTLEAIVQKDFFNGLSAPATLTLIGPTSTTACPSCTPAIPGTTFTFNPGSSSVTVYSGQDAVTTDIIPPIGTSNGTNLETVEDSVAGLPPHPFNGTVTGSPSDISSETPWWLTSPLQLDNAVRQLATVASSSGRFFPSGTQPTTFGDNATAQGITFCDGNCEFTGDGGGILVVTGKLTLRGNFSFNGLVIVTGQGGVDRMGGGDGTIQGNMVIAPYVGSRIQDGITPTSTAQFLAPQYDLSGGGNSTVAYNSSSVAGGLVAVSNFVLGVVEK